ncbi:MAG: RluA family pseudouridine synthase [Clostridia bacterium]|nr:RluA family pseudouridine synthase [Clostridia bacterium]
MELLYSDKNIFVIIKPVGLDSEKDVPAKLREDFGGEVFTLHRLDKNVGGVMVYARNKASAAALSKAIQNGEMVKVYLALVHGTPEEEGVFEDFLFKDSKKNKVFVVKRQRKGVKKAKLEYTLLKGGEESLVKIRLHTGRSHQIRVQFSSRGFPLVGDHKYGSKSEVKEPRLFSHQITFPYKGENLTFSATPNFVNDNTLL